MNKTKPIIFHVIWFAAVTLLSIYLVFNLHTITDIKQFIPADKEDSTFHTLQSELLSRSESSSILLNIHGANAEELVRLSRGLRAEFTETDSNVILQNGEESFDTTGIEILNEKRFLLVDTDWSVEGLKQALKQRISDLRHGQGPVIGQLIKSDPYLSVKKYFQSIERPTTLDKQYPVWYAHDTGAILRVDFRNEDVDLDTIEQTQEILNSIFQELSPPESARLEMTGPGAIAVATREEIRTVTQRLSWVVPLLLLLVFWIAYRSVFLAWYAGIPLVTGALVALVVTQVVFANVHGVVIAFGITMLGVALDYPVHLFSHKYPDEALRTSASRIWPVLRLGGFSSAGAFLVLLFSGFEGLSQLGVYAGSGLITALLVTRYFLPVLTNMGNVKPRLFVLHQNMPMSYTIIILMLIVISVLVPWIQRDIHWNDSVDALSPVSQEKKKQDAKLRDIIGGMEVSDIFVLEDADLNRLLVSTEQLSENLSDLVNEGIVSAVFPVTDFLPSATKQKARQKAIPQSQELQQRVRYSVENTPFNKSAFQEFIELAEKAKQQDIISYEEILRSPAGPIVRQGLIKTGDSWLSVVRVSGLSSPERFTDWLDENPNVKKYHINIREQVSNLFGKYRERTLSGVILVLIILAVIVFVYCRNFITSLRLISPVFIGVAGGLAAGLLVGQGLNIFHLMAVFLVIGMGFDYSLFFNHGRGNKDVFSRSFHAISISAVTTVTLFIFLALSPIPVLSAMGSVIVAGILLSFASAWLVAGLD
ncbi:MMPL family transporter [Thiohalophilus thiocyanatoxydans]|uniref:Putative exporter n=1 Tax=Thiohalophilus thiocyanatoxydans TaxID=381308 RepID=A0A4R8IQR1_9GAMM|nr:MMPL family transporter [Thiohalophilus thiocyanatoxydans]TDY02918.1 putative exporter [Thiohalophilus thiocyanatoxydans]